MCEQNQDLLEQPWNYPQLFEENKKQNQYLQKFSSAVLNGENRAATTPVTDTPHSHPQKSQQLNQQLKISAAR